MLNLEQSIAAWRAQMKSAGLKNSEILDELENHLREDCVRRVNSGESEEQAFERAAQEIGAASVLKHEFAKISGKKWAWLAKLKRNLSAAFAPVPSLNTFTSRARWTLELARHEAPRLHHGFVGTEHVLLGLLTLEDGLVPNVLKNMGVDRQAVRRKINDWVSGFPPGKMRDNPPYTPRVQKTLRLAALEAKLTNDNRVGAEHLLLGLLLESEGVAGRVLRDFGLSPETTREEIRREQNKSGNKDDHV